MEMEVYQNLFIKNCFNNEFAPGNKNKMHDAIIEGLAYPKNFSNSEINNLMRRSCILDTGWAKIPSWWIQSPLDKPKSELHSTREAHSSRSLTFFLLL